MGVGHMHVYDLDGSFAEAVKPWVKLGLVTYTPRFSLHPEYLHNYEGRKADYHGVRSTLHCICALTVSSRVAALRQTALQCVVSLVLCDGLHASAL